MKLTEKVRFRQPNQTLVFSPIRILVKRGANKDRQLGVKLGRYLPIEGSVSAQDVNNFHIDSE